MNAAAENITEGFSAWCVVELMGHVTLAGFVTEQEIAGSKLIRIDIPETESNPGFSKMVGTSSIYGITPVDEATVMMICKRPQRPFSSYELQEAFDKYFETRLEREMPGIEDRVRRSLTHDSRAEACPVHPDGHQFDCGPDGNPPADGNIADYCVCGAQQPS